MSLVQPHFNRLTVIDGRYPHGVRPVEGTRDPLKARLVLHGWFTEPTPFFEGGSSFRDAVSHVLRVLQNLLHKRLSNAGEILAEHAPPYRSGPVDEQAAVEALNSALEGFYEVNSCPALLKVPIGHTHDARLVTKLDPP